MHAACGLGGCVPGELVVSPRTRTLTGKAFAHVVQTSHHLSVAHTSPSTSLTPTLVLFGTRHHSPPRLYISPVTPDTPPHIEMTPNTCQGDSLGHNRARTCLSPPSGTKWQIRAHTSGGPSMRRTSAASAVHVCSLLGADGVDGVRGVRPSCTLSICSDVQQASVKMVV